MSSFESAENRNVRSANTQANDRAGVIVTQPDNDLLLHKRSQNVALPKEFEETSADFRITQSENTGNPQPSEQVKRMEADVAKYGKSPDDMLTQLMRDNQVVGIGDGHGSNEPLERDADKYMRDLKAGGATHLVIETDQTTKAMLDRFNATGELDVSKLPILSRNDAYVNMLKSAHAMGLTLVAGDAEQGKTANQSARNPTMASTIENILNQPGQDRNHPNKVVFWVGARHLDDFHLSKTSNNSSAAVLLRADGVKIATVGYESGGQVDGGDMSQVANSVTRPTIVSTTDAKDFGGYKTAGIYPNNSLDYIILYPPDH